MTADSTVAEIEAAGDTALGIEVDVRDQEAVGQWSHESSRNGAVLMSWSRTKAESVRRGT